MADFPVIPGYKFKSVLGEGGVAKVYLAIQEKINREVAVKILDPFLLKNKITASRFEIEAKTAANLSHSNIIQIFDTGKAGDYHYIVMEYLEESLKDRMNRSPQGKMDPEAALEIFEEIFKALDYAHLKGIYHRDIKPENIMFRQDSTLVLLDFGLARVFDSRDGNTRSGLIMGTTDYMSPEQCRAKEVDGRSDIYSLGVVLFEMLTGEKPYKGETEISVALQHIEKPIPRLPKDLNPYQSLIDKMMAKDREKRLSSGAQFVELLNRIRNNPLGFTSQPVESTPSPIVKPQGDSIYKEQTQNIGSLFNDFRDLLKKKLNSFKKYLARKIVKKVVIWVLPVVLLLVIFIVVLNQCPSTLKLEKTSNQLLSQHLKLIEESFYKKKDLKCVKKGLKRIEKVKKIKTNRELVRLKLKFTECKEKLDEYFKKYLDEAEKYYNDGNYSEAKKSISKAEKIKITPKSKRYREAIDEKIQEQQKG
jgi:serine/threonine protein kinase